MRGGWWVVAPIAGYVQMEDSRFVDSCRSSPKKLCRNNVPRIPGGSSDSDIARYQSHANYPRYARPRKMPQEIWTLRRSPAYGDARGDVRSSKGATI